MQELPIEQVKLNMKLACSVRNPGGDIIGAAGAPVTEQFLAQCDKLSIYTLHILGNPVAGAPKSYDAKKRFSEVSRLFRNHQENVFMRTFETFLKKHFHERI